MPQINIPQNNNNMTKTLMGAAGGIAGGLAGGPAGAIAGGMLGGRMGGEAPQVNPVAGPAARRMDHLTNAQQIQDAQKVLDQYPEYKREFGPVLNNAANKARSGGVA